MTHNFHNESKEFYSSALMPAGHTKHIYISATIVTWLTRHIRNDSLDTAALTKHFYNDTVTVASLTSNSRTASLSSYNQTVNHVLFHIYLTAISLNS